MFSKNKQIKGKFVILHSIEIMQMKSKKTKVVAYFTFYLYDPYWM